MNHTYRPQLFGMISTESSRHYTPHAFLSLFETTPIRPADSVRLIVNDRPLDQTSTPPLVPEPIASRVSVTVNDAPRGFSDNGNTLIEEAVRSKSDLVLLNNDLIFSPGWFDPFIEERRAILSPLSNRELQYDSGPFITHVVMELDHYVGREREWRSLAAIHRTQFSGTVGMLVLPFFSVRIPFEALVAIGSFDPAYGLGGGEDYDYCLRAHDAGFGVAYARGSYILHFGGRSSWSVEEEAARLHREKIFLDRFRETWGATLFQLIFSDTPPPIHLADLAAQGRYRDLIREARVLPGSRS